MKKVVLNPNPTRDKNLDCTRKVASFFKENGVEVYISKDISGAETTGATLSDFGVAVKDADMIISFGGDGTLLHTANEVAGLGIPVLGINIGRIGYMAELEANEIEYLKKVLDGNYHIEERMRIEISIKRNEETVYRKTALNDAVIMKTGLMWIVDMDIFADEMFISSYSGDGVIIATPTGSTAYSLSAGGPIIDPISKNITITPVCTHALSAKPIVLSHKRRITILPQSSENGAIAISTDGDAGFELMHGDIITIKTAEEKTKLIHVKNANFYDVLYTKLSDRRFE